MKATENNNQGALNNTTLINDTDEKIKVCLFVRISTSKQDVSRQISDLTKTAERLNYKIVDIISETISGAKKNEDRKGIVELLEKAKAKQFTKVLVSEVSRLGRNTTEVLKAIEALRECDVNVYLNDLNMETDENNPMSELLLYITSLFSKQERSTLISRVKSGIVQYRKDNDGVWGRRKGSTETKEEFLNKYSKLIKCLELGLSVRQICKLQDVSQNTVMKVRKQLGLYNQIAA